MSIGTIVNGYKNGILLAYIADKIPGIHLRKLLKIIYLMDEYFMKVRGFPLTWFEYFAWEKGPVALDVYNIKNGAFEKFVKYYRTDVDKTIINLIPNISELLEATFSKKELGIIDKLIFLYKDHTADELSDITHIKDSLWSKVVDANGIVFDRDHRVSNCRIYLETLFSKDDWRLAKYRDALWSMEFEAKLSSDSNPEHKIQLHVVLPSEKEEYRSKVYSPAIP